MSIRTTVTLEEDVLERVKEEGRKRGIPFRQALNDLLREGLLAARTPAAGRSFRVRPVRMGTRPGISYDDVSALLDLGEGESRR